jgi:hypothetical protein
MTKIVAYTCVICFRINISGEDVFYSPNFDPAMKEGGGGAELDMAIMAQCNHTIISHGKMPIMAQCKHP